MAAEATIREETRELIERYNLSPLWEIEEHELGTERQNLKPELWKWANIEEVIEQIAADVPIDELPPGLRRRVAVPVNPAYPGSISHTIYLGIQTVSPGETAPAHRHGANAVRFTIQGTEEMKTAVGGEEFPMRDNDLITTPQWEWHDHINESEEEVAWLDILDLPLVFNSLNVGNHMEDHEAERHEARKPSGYWESQFGTLTPSKSANDEIPGPFQGTRAATPPHRFAWEECQTSLQNAAREGLSDPHDGVSMDYVNPATGDRPLFPTFDVRAQLVTQSTAAHRHNATEVYYVIEGSGATHVDGDTLEWDKRDIFLVPPNVVHAHDPDGEATLLAITDRPLLEGINFYFETDEV